VTVLPLGLRAAARRLVLMRHGRTAWNATRRAQGHTDVDLDEVGHAQAVAAAPVVASYRPSVLVSSDLARARQTAGPVGEETGLEVAQDPRLREYDLGDRTGMTMAEYAAEFPDEHAAFLAGRYEAVPGAEATAEVQERVVEALSEVLAGLGPGETGVAVFHGAALKAGLIAMLGWPEEHLVSLRGMDNCHWAVLQEADTASHLRLTAYNVGASA
jgi:probable phosphoglycerate mutase